MSRVVVACVALALATPAIAQNTDCERTPTGFSCSTSPSPQAGFAVLGAALAQRRQAKQIAAAFVDAVANGRCDEARQLATAYGDAKDLATVAQRCVSPQDVQAQVDDQAAQLERNWMAAVTRRVAEGQCEDAKQMALNASRLDVADQVVRVCTPKP